MSIQLRGNSESTFSDDISAVDGAFSGNIDLGSGNIQLNADGTASFGGGAINTDSSGRLLVGTFSTAQVSTAVFQGRGSTTGSAVVRLCTTDATPANGVALGNLTFGDNGHSTSAQISALRDAGTWTSGSSQPTRLVFSTTADGASSPTERMRIKASGIVNIANTPTYADNAAALVGGLVAGDVYRKSDGTLMITY